MNGHPRKSPGILPLFFGAQKEYQAHFSLKKQVTPKKKNAHYIKKTDILWIFYKIVFQRFFPVERTNRSKWSPSWGKSKTGSHQKPHHDSSGSGSKTSKSHHSQGIVEVGWKTDTSHDFHDLLGWKQLLYHCYQNIQNFTLTSP